jgi:UDP-N-acetylmuramoyl-L-alanyl-D-glutamate--2,6-diaminopimelate ligase
MRLADVIPGAPAPARDLEVTDLAYDNRQVTPGTLFFCVPGFTRDGHDFAPDAIAQGAVALVVERPLSLGVPEITVPSVRAAMAPAAAAFYKDPTADLQTVGVTGANGKTTTSFLVRAMLEADGRRTGLLSTVKSIIGGVEHPVVRTTPEAIATRASALETSRRVSRAPASRSTRLMGGLSCSHRCAARSTSTTCSARGSPPGRHATKI